MKGTLSDGKATIEARERLSRQISSDFHTLVDILAAECPAPDGHRWEAPPLELKWWNDDILQSTHWGASVFLARTARDCTDSDQIHAEVRWFWRSTTGDRVPDPSNVRHEAILWCQHGARFSGGYRNLLVPAEQFPKAGAVSELAHLCALTIRSALARVTSRSSRHSPGPMFPSEANDITVNLAVAGADQPHFA